MSRPPVDSLVTDTGPLISLERLDGGYKFMRQMYRRIWAPPAVLSELAEGYQMLDQLLHNGRISRVLFNLLVASLAVEG